MACLIKNCNRKKMQKYCTRHTSALKNLNSAYPIWENAFMDKMTMDKYLEKLVIDDAIEVGTWIKDVARHLLEKMGNKS